MKFLYLLSLKCVSLIVIHYLYSTYMKTQYIKKILRLMTKFETWIGSSRITCSLIILFIGSYTHHYYSCYVNQSSWNYFIVVLVIKTQSLFILCQLVFLKLFDCSSCIQSIVYIQLSSDKNHITRNIYDHQNFEWRLIGLTSTSLL